eukprot:TRINITY_DN3887_c0_g1_i12.p1 TRINITY_DN3887_c0_g1~~TRINITY_DN3887_c0_g1_i12.p1  ORF type:complete len:645 (-),score=124.94 TRINITY_DN3887_c0_g1_i12:1498-3432(-)
MLKVGSRSNVVGPVCVATPSRPPSSKTAKRSKVEIIKEKSDYLRHPLMEQLVNENPNISEEAMQLMKFHGSYQQDHREKRAFGQGKFYQFMMRTRTPAGSVSNQLYLTMDDLADQFGNGTLRLTTRQAFQLHGVLKKDLKTVFSTVIKNMGSTLGACGDVNRNVLATPAPFKDRPEFQFAEDVARDIADLLAPQSGAYYDVWLDGEKWMSMEMENPKVVEDRKYNRFGTNFDNSPEPIYGSQFLPRKFKVAVTVPGDNSIDILTNDIGVVVITNDKGELQGYNIVVGGGMGRTHRNESTFPRLADALGYVDKDDIFHAIKAIVATQRDYGRRDDRKQARMKYLVDEWGIDKFRSVVEQYYGKSFENYKPLPPWKYIDYTGWHEQGDGKLFYGVFVQNGRIKGDLKRAIRTIIERYELHSKITAHQNLILCDIDPQWKQDIDLTLRAAGVHDPSEMDQLDMLAMACPALPLCGLAIGEAERGLPDVLKRIRSLLVKVGLPDESMVVRMTGCPNGCSRPYMAELGFVGDGPNSYQLWLGGSTNQTRLAEVFMERLRVSELENTLEPIFFYWRLNRKGDEGFGDFCARVGFDAIREYVEKYIPVDMQEALPMVGLDDDTYQLLQNSAQSQGKSVSHLVSELLNPRLQ